MNNSLNQNLNKKNSDTINWDQIQDDFKIKFGNDVFESWLKKMQLLEINSDYLLIAVPTRFIRDWITSRYLDNVIQVIKSHNKNINRIEFKINSATSFTSDKKNLSSENTQNSNIVDANVTFIKDTFIQYINVNFF